MTYDLTIKRRVHSLASFLKILGGLVIYRITQFLFRECRSRTTSIPFTMNRIKFFAVVIAGLVLATSVRAQNDQTVSADDTARFLAGMQLSPHSPLAQFAQDPNIKPHAAYFEAAFDKVEKNQLTKVRAWSAANLTAPKPVLFYMFGGPDFLYANAFFPNATTYVLSGLEPVGQIPDLLKLPRPSLAAALRNMQSSLRNILTVSYFITSHMSQDLNASSLNGTLPILYVFLARSGKTVHDVSLVHLDEQGALHPGDGARPRMPARGVKIMFSENNGPQKTLYYFSTNLADESAKNIALLQFMKTLGQGDSFVKSASYLMHNANFSQVRNFLLDNSSVILQDDTGVPARMLDPVKWELRPFGRYTQPIPVFEGMYQTKLNEVYQRNRPIPIDFGVGYRWHPSESNLLLVIRTSAPEATASISQVSVPPNVQVSPPTFQAAPRPAETVQRTAEAAPRRYEVETDNSGKSIYSSAPPSYRPNNEFQQARRPPPPDAPLFLFPFILFMPPPTP